MKQQFQKKKITQKIYLIKSTKDIDILSHSGALHK